MTAIILSLFIVTGSGANWGYEAVADAKIDAIERAKAECNSDVEQMSEWQTRIINRKEGFFRAEASAEFRCVENI